MNKPLLRKLIKKFTRFPGVVAMEAWAHKTSKTDEVPCGTIGCIAGHAIALSVSPSAFARLLHRQNTEPYTTPLERPIARKAMELLDLDEEQAGRLFYPEEWPEELKNDLNSADDDVTRQSEYAGIVCDRIALFITTKGAE